MNRGRNRYNIYRQDSRSIYPPIRPYFDGFTNYYPNGIEEYPYQNHYECNNYSFENRQYCSNYQRPSRRALRKSNNRRYNSFAKPVKAAERLETTIVTRPPSNENISNINVDNSISANEKSKDEVLNTPPRNVECADLDLSDAETVQLEDEEQDSVKASCAEHIQSTAEDLNDNKISCSKDKTSAASASEIMSPHKCQLVLSESSRSENVKGDAKAHVKSSAKRCHESDHKNKLSTFADKPLEKSTTEKVFNNIASPPSKENIPMKIISQTHKYQDGLKHKTNTGKREFKERTSKFALKHESSTSRKDSKGNESVKRKSKNLGSLSLDMPSLDQDEIIGANNTDLMSISDPCTSKSTISSEKLGSAIERKDICKKHVENKTQDSSEKQMSTNEILTNKVSTKEPNMYAKVYKERKRDHIESEKKKEKVDKATFLKSHSNNKDKCGKDNDKHKKAERTSDRKNEKCSEVYINHKKKERSTDKKKEKYSEININDKRNGRTKDKKSENTEVNINDNSRITKSIGNQKKSRPTSVSSEVWPKAKNQRVYIGEKKDVSVTMVVSTPAPVKSEPIAGDITLINENAGTIELEGEDILNDKEVEEIMTVELAKNAVPLGKRGKSCIPFKQKHHDASPDLVRSKSIQGRDLLCYTPFRITRSMSKNWRIIPGIPNAGVRRSFADGLEDDADEPIPKKKRRQTIGVGETPSEIPSLFSEQTPYTKPAEIDFAFTPRYNDEYLENITEPSEVTVIYGDNVVIDPRKPKITYNGRELIKYNDYVKENAPAQRCRSTSKDGAPKKIGGRRKSTAAKNEDPDYKPYCKIVCSPRCNEPPINNNEGKDVPQNRGSEDPQSAIPSQKSLNNSSNTRTADKKKTKERANETSMQKLENVTSKAISSEESASKLLKSSKQKEWLEANLKQSDKCVACISHACKEVCVPLAVKTPRICNAISTTEPVSSSLLIENARVATNISEQVKICTSVSLENRFDRLGNYFFIIKTLECIRIYQEPYFRSLPIPDEVKVPEVTGINNFYQARLRHYLRKFHSICETIDWKHVSPDIFMSMLTNVVRKRQPTLKYPNFLWALHFIMSKCMPSTATENYATKMQTYVRSHQLAYNRSNISRRMSSVTTNQNEQNQGTSSSNVLDNQNQEPRPVPQQRQRAVQNPIPVPPAPASSIMTPKQRQTLKQQIVQYKQLMQNYRTIAPRAPSQNLPARIAKKSNDPELQAPSIMALRSFLQSQLPRNTHSSTLPCRTVPDCSRTDVSNPCQKNGTTCNSTIMSSSSACCPVNISPNKLQVNSVLSQSSKSRVPDPIPREQVVPSAVCVNIGPDSSKARLGSVTCSDRTDGTTEEFVDFECYFGHSDDVEVKQNLEESVASSNEVPAKRRRLSDVEIIHEDPPPRNPSTDSGLDSPCQDDSDAFADYENRVCHCGKRAVYLCPCKAVMYCSGDCQLVDWANHKDSSEHKSNTSKC